MPQLNAAGNAVIVMAVCRGKNPPVGGVGLYPSRGGLLPGRGAGNAEGAAQGGQSGVSQGLAAGGDSSVLGGAGGGGLLNGDLNSDLHRHIAAVSGGKDHRLRTAILHFGEGLALLPAPDAVHIGGTLDRGIGNGASVIHTGDVLGTDGGNLLFGKGDDHLHSGIVIVGGPDGDW